MNSVKAILIKPGIYFALSILILLFPLFVTSYDWGLFSHMKIILPSWSRFISFIFLIIGFFFLYKKKYNNSFIFNREKLSLLEDLSDKEIVEIITKYFNNLDYQLDSRKEKYLIYTKHEEKIIVDFSYYKNKYLNSYPIKNLYIKYKNDCTYFYIITGGLFTKSAKIYIQNKKINLINGFEFIEWKNK